MGLEHRGNRFTEDEDIIRLLDARTAAEGIPSASDAAQLIESRTSDFASKSYVDSAFSGYATSADVNAAYANKVPYSEIGSSIFALNSEGQIPPSQLPALTTRGAKWVSGPGLTPRDNVGDGGIFSTSVQLSSVYVNGTSLMGGRPYHMLGFAQVEVKGNFSASQPIISISTGTTLGTAISEGYGIPGWMDFYHVSVMPGASNTPTAWTGNRYMYLTCRSGYASSNFSNYYPSWGILLIPASSG